jgi:hypothetical protein
MVTNAFQTTSSVAPSKLVCCRTFARAPDGRMRHRRAASASSEKMKNRRPASERERPGHCVQLRLREIPLCLREHLLHHGERFPDLLEQS